MSVDDSFEMEMYRDPALAGSAVDRLHQMGYGREDIGVMMDDKTRERAFAAMTNSKGSEGIAAGATIGGVLGAIVAGVTATGSVAVIAGTGGLAAPFVAGPLVAALAGLGAGGAAGGIVGGLIGAGIAEDRAKKYEQGLREGGVLVAVRPKGPQSRHDVRRVLEANDDAGVERRSDDADVEYAGEVSEARLR
jgi:hypothetical protein